MSLNPESYVNSFRKRVRILFSPLHLTLFGVAIIFWVISNGIVMSNGGEPAWLGPLSVIPLFAFWGWTAVTDAKMRELDRGSGEEGAEVSTNTDLDVR
ncbi:hypothetical protein [Microbacterium oxydans]|uniref:hypothetical protein n=1 Tax=Microbacterium oxydans TaxID=82380 RepID=UPI0024ACC58A|nr:hypothetical protein [Microbacterium oxydans]